ncbi:MAG TPA: YciI family protein [Streptosporangiaceae bacterium]|nr:YciI family protein [Streptosporangiaceae bacterium]
MEFDRLTVGLLMGRDDAPELTAEEEDTLQDAHLAHLAGLHEAGVLLAAGPLQDRNASFRGLVMLSVDADEARPLLERDPAVRAGRFDIVLLPWLVPSGAMAFSPTRFPHSMAEAAGP